jgi:hypothetical protein
LDVEMTTIMRALEAGGPYALLALSLLGMMRLYRDLRSGVVMPIHSLLIRMEATRNRTRAERFFDSVRASPTSAGVPAVTVRKLATALAVRAPAARAADLPMCSEREQGASDALPQR